MARTTQPLVPSALSSTDLERRHRARDQVSLDLRRWLEQARQRYRMRALVLADASGCLIAGAGVAPECQRLAAFAPLGGLPEHPRPLALGRGEAFVCASPVSLLVSQWTEIVNGCARILGRRGLA